MANRDGKGDVAHSPRQPSQDPAARPAPAAPIRPLASRTPTRANNRDLRRRFGEIVRTERIRRAMSQQDLAFRSKVHRTHVSLAECGHRDLRMTTICALAAALHIQPGALMPPLP